MCFFLSMSKLKGTLNPKKVSQQHRPTCLCAQAVGTDNQLRVWYASTALDMGLLFGCQGAIPELNQPLGESVK